MDTTVRVFSDSFFFFSPLLCFNLFLCHNFLYFCIHLLMAYQHFSSSFHFTAYFCIVKMFSRFFVSFSSLITIASRYSTNSLLWPVQIHYISQLLSSTDILNYVFFFFFMRTLYPIWLVSNQHKKKHAHTLTQTATWKTSVATICSIWFYWNWILHHFSWNQSTRLHSNTITTASSAAFWDFD